MLRTLAINSNQIVLSFGVLIAFDHQSNPRLRRVIWNLGQSNWKLRTWRSKALKSFAKSKSRMQGEEERESAMKHILDDSRVSHFWSTFWSPIDACYIPFQTSGSQKSNASNSAQFGVETKKLQPLQVNHSKLKKAFCKSVAKSPFCCEVISQPFCTVWWISS